MEGFDADSAPYLLPTEHPWEALSPIPLKGRRVLAVAGSGDIPLLFASRDPASLEVVDVSRRACFLAELKRAAYRHLPRREFLRFFFADAVPSVYLLDNAKETSTPEPPGRLVLYRTLRPDLTSEAQGFFDAFLTAQGEQTNPFAQFLRPTDVFHGSLFPPLVREEAYRTWAYGARRPFPIHCRALEDFLAETPSCFDFIYTSNVFEYLRARYVVEASASVFRASMRSFWESLHRVLSPGGRVVFYLCQGQETALFPRLLKELAPPRSMRYKRHLVPVILRPPALPGTVWRHVVVFFEKASSKTREAR
ncbi:MAG: DUF3419 family protein [Desulfosoma sp.]